MFFKFLVFLLIASTNATYLSEGLALELPKTLEHISEIVTMHVFAFSYCARSFDFSGGNSTEFGKYQRENPGINCFWECVLTNIDMMKDGHLEYVGPAENVILKIAFDTCSESDIMKTVDGCPLAQMFLMCEYRVVLKDASDYLIFFYQDLMAFYNYSNALLKGLEAKMEIIREKILEGSLFFT